MIPSCSSERQEDSLSDVTNPGDTPNASPWPEITEGKWARIKGLNQLTYDNLYDQIEAGEVPPSVLEGHKPNEESRKPSVKDDPEWVRGYEYLVKVPAGYFETAKPFPLVMFLHGGAKSSPGKWNWLTNQFHMPEDDPYIIVTPAKKELDWNPQKTIDVITDIKAHLRVDVDRIYLTGLSMGGRGTYIVAAVYPEVFAALMPLSSHHSPYSYVPLAPRVAHLPIWTSHGDRDSVSSHNLAAKMVGTLENLQSNVTFVSIPREGHGGWEKIYRRASTFEWLLSHQRNIGD